MAVHPNPSGLHDFATLGAGDGLERTAEGGPPPRLHFEEGNQVAAPRDKVQLDPSNAKAVRDDLPTAGLQVTDRLLFTGQSSLLTRVAPMFRVAVNAARHAPKLAGFASPQ